MKDKRLPTERREMAQCLREILSGSGYTREYARAFCWCVLINFRTGFLAIPKRDDQGRWHPRAWTKRNGKGKPFFRGN